MALIIALLQPFSLGGEVKAANYPGAKPYGFEVDSNDFVDLGWAKNVIYATSYWQNVPIGIVSLTMLFARAKTKVGADRLHVAMYHITMSPYLHEVDGDMLRCYSEMVRIESKMTAPRKYVSSYPENVAGKSSYTVGGNIGLSGKGISGGISATTTITKDRLKITNRSSLATNTYRVEYDYIPAWFGEWTSKNAYLNNISTQRGVFYYDSNDKVFNFPVTVYAQFGIMSGFLSLSHKTWSVDVSRSIQIS